jgi:hypothetical protein
MRPRKDPQETVEGQNPKVHTSPPLAQNPLRSLAEVHFPKELALRSREMISRNGDRG